MYYKFVQIHISAVVDFVIRTPTILLDQDTKFDVDLDVDLQLKILAT